MGQVGFSCWSADVSRRVIFPEFRTGLYAIWRACNRLRVRPPGLPETWDECSGLQQAMILAFDQVAEHDQLERDAALAGATLQ